MWLRLSFLPPLVRGRTGGYLVSHETPSEHLCATNVGKLLVGYPMDSVDEAFRGKMHEAGSTNVVFDRLPDSDTVYDTANLAGYPGTSGGPLCVQYTNGMYYPAAVYIGSSGSSAHVRVIDADVADLIQQAADLSQATEQHTPAGLSL